MKFSVILFILGLVSVAFAKPTKKEVANEFLRYVLRELTNEEGASEMERRDQEEAETVDKRDIHICEVTAEHMIKVDPQIDLSTDVCVEGNSEEVSDCLFRIQLFEYTSSDAVTTTYTQLDYPIEIDTSNAAKGTEYRIKCCRVDGNSDSASVIEVNNKQVCDENYCTIPAPNQSAECSTTDPHMSQDINAAAIQDFINILLSKGK